MALLWEASGRTQTGYARGEGVGIYLVADVRKRKETQVSRQKYQSVSDGFKTAVVLGARRIRCCVWIYSKTQSLARVLELLKT